MLGLTLTVLGASLLGTLLVPRGTKLLAFIAMIAMQLYFNSDAIRMIAQGVQA